MHITRIFVALSVATLAGLMIPTPTGIAGAGSADAELAGKFVTEWDPFVTLAEEPGEGARNDDEEADEDDDDEDDDDNEERRGNRIRALITSGDVVGNGFTFSNIPDGIGAVEMREGAVDVFVNHELNNGRDHGGWAKVSRLRLRDGTATLLRAEMAIDGSQGYERFCAASAVEGSGFRHPVYFTNEEVEDGIVVAVDAKTREIIEMPWLGEFSHENTIHVPWFYTTARKTVVLSFEDGEATESEVYMYVSDSPRDLLSGRGTLYVFAATDGGTYREWDDVYYHTGPVAGRFVPLTWDWRTEDHEDLHAEAIAAGAFRFIRPEDGAMDKRRGLGNVLYMADTGNDRDENGQPIPPGENGQTWERGRIYRFAFTDRRDPTRATFRVWLDGNDPSAPGFGVLINPDNVDTSRRSLMIQEDRIGATREPVTTPYDLTRNAKIIRVDLATGAVSIVAYVNQYADPAAQHGNWESSGILDVSRHFGPGSWLLTVQAHSIREGGQLLLMTIGGT